MNHSTERMSNEATADRRAVLAAVQALLAEREFVAGVPVHLANDQVRIWIDFDPETGEHILTMFQEFPAVRPLSGVKVSSIAVGSDKPELLGETDSMGQLDVATWVPGRAYHLVIEEGRAGSIESYLRIFDDAWQATQSDAAMEPARRLTQEITSQCGLHWCETSPSRRLAGATADPSSPQLPERSKSVEEWDDWVVVDIAAEEASFGIARLIVQSAADHRPLGRALITLSPRKLRDGSHRLGGRIRWEQLLGRPTKDRIELGRLEYFLIPARDDTLPLFSLDDVKELLALEDVAGNPDLRQEVEGLQRALQHASKPSQTDEEP